MIGSSLRGTLGIPGFARAVLAVIAMFSTIGSERVTLNVAPLSRVHSNLEASAPATPGSTEVSQAGDVLCHNTRGSRTFVRIAVAGSAVAAHLGHGDGRVDEGVPGEPTLVFGADCSLIPAPPTGPITFAISGEVTEIRDPNNILAGSIFLPTPGDAIVGTYTIDPAAVGFPLSPEITHYAFSPTPPFGMSLQIGSTALEAFPGFLAINIANDHPTVGDRYTLFTTPTAPLLSGITWVQVGFELGTVTNLSVFDSTALPLALPDLSLFDTQNEFFLSFVSDAGQIGFVLGRLSSITRVP